MTNLSRADRVAERDRRYASDLAEVIEIAKSAGFRVYSIADTGSVYMTRDDGRKLRISNHKRCIKRLCKEARRRIIDSQISINISRYGWRDVLAMGIVESNQPERATNPQHFSGPQESPRDCTGASCSPS